MLKSYKYEELSASQFAQALEEMPLVYLPFGTLEYHGPHLPLGMDTIHAYEFCLRVAQKTGGIVLPPSYWGTIGHDGWKGSLLVSEETFRALIRDIFRLLAQQGVKLIVATTGHNPKLVGEIIAKIAQESMGKNPSTRILTLDPYGTNPEDKRADHAGKKETSLMLAIRPELVHMDELLGDNAFKGIWEDCVDGTEDFGTKYLRASVENCTSIVREAWNDMLANKPDAGDPPGMDT